MSPKFQVYEDTAGKFRFRLRADNNKIVAVGEAYEQHTSCMNGIKSIQKNCNSEIEDLTIEDRKVSNPKYQIFKDTTDKYRFHLKASNGEIIAQSERYQTKEDCLDAVGVVKNSCNAEIEDLSGVIEPSEDKISHTKSEDLAVSPKPTEMGTETALTGAEKEASAQTVPTKPVEIEIPKVSSPAETKKATSAVKELLISFLGLVIALIFSAFSFGHRELGNRLFRHNWRCRKGSSNNSRSNNNRPNNSSIRHQEVLLNSNIKNQISLFFL